MVPDRRASHHRPERTGRGAWGNAARLGLPGLASTDLASRLVEPRGHAPLPVLVEVGLQDHAIPAGRHGCGRKASSEEIKLAQMLSLNVQVTDYANTTKITTCFRIAMSQTFTGKKNTHNETKTHNI